MSANCVNLMSDNDPPVNPGSVNAGSINTGSVNAVSVNVVSVNAMSVDELPVQAVSVNAVPFTAVSANAAPVGAPPRLSVAIVAHESDAGLAGTLASVKKMAQQVVVCAIGASNVTAATARQFGAEPVACAADDDYSAARNAVLPKLTGDWILWLEPGERMTEAAAAELTKFMQESADPRSLYMLLVMAPASPGQISGEQVGQIRLIPNRRELRFNGRVRPSLIDAATDAGMSVAGLPWRILRSAGEYSVPATTAAARRDLRIAELEIEERGPLPRLLVARGEALLRLKDPTATAVFAQACRGGAARSTELREAFYGLLNALDADPAAREVQAKICLEALEAFPLDAQLLSAMGAYLEQDNRLDLAAQTYKTAFEHGEIDPQAWHVSDIHEIAAISFSLTLQMQNKDNEALQALERALERFPNSSRVRRHLIDWCVKHDDRKRALAEVDRLSANTPHHEALRAAVRGACLAAKQQWSEARVFLDTAYKAGCRDILCLRWLAATLLACGARSEAASIVAEWQALEPESGELRAYQQAVAPARDVPRAPIVNRGPHQLRIDPASALSGAVMLSSLAPAEAS
jgi:tetratricopeptide (TPR) repeat protein